MLCDYNRDGDSYRSPWSNEYFPALDDGFLPTDKLRELEGEANALFDAYRELYFEGGVSSVYLWDLDNGFAGSFLIKKSMQSDKFVKEGSWDSIHIVEVMEETGSKSATYKLTTTIMLNMTVNNADLANTGLSGSLTRQSEVTKEVNATNTHCANMGRLIEDMEIEMRGNMNELYMKKTLEVVSSIRNANPEAAKLSKEHVAKLNAAVMSKGNKDKE
mgnify:CR=1 FL=1